ncbi:MAG: right-handed parallel beta-helix repeat-containing protein [Methanomassiliicoccaceae archaeon]|nr:right-handed parallel beta-helix repeat-containing protein [Methanomassiliicoccaceae archaeon]
MSEHEKKKRGRYALFSIAVAAIFVAAAFASVTAGSTAPADDDAYLGSGATYTVGEGGDYEDFTDLLGSVTLADGDTIELVSDIECLEMFVIDGIGITIDMDGNDIEFVLTDLDNFAGIYVKDGSLTIINGGKIVVDGIGKHGIFVFEACLTANVNIEAGASGYGIYADTSEVTFTGDIKVGDEEARGINAKEDSVVTATGSITTGPRGWGIVAADTSEVTFTGNIYLSHSSIGVNAYESAVITVTGNIMAGIDMTLGLADGVTGISAIDNAVITFTGNVNALGDESLGIYASHTTEVTIDGNVTVGDLSTGIQVYDSAVITVTGNVTVGEDGVGVYAGDGGEATIGGKLIVGDGSDLIVLYEDGADPDETILGSGDNTTPTTKAGYLTYTDGTSTVWIKEEGGNNGGMNLMLVIVVALIIVGAVASTVWFFFLRK